MNRAGIGLKKDSISNNNQTILVIGDPLQSPHHLKWATKVEVERKKDDKDTVGENGRNVKTNWKFLERMKSSKEVNENSNKDKNTLQKFGNFWRRDNVSFVTF